MRTAVLLYVMFVVFAFAPTIAVGQPTVAIYTDEDAYRSGETIEVNLSAQNPGDAMSVDVYIGLLLPEGSLLLIDQGGTLTGAVTPWVENFDIPAGFELARTPFFWFGVPVGVEGDFQFTAGLAWPGTLNFVGEISYAPFSIGGSGPSTDITMVPIPAGSFLMGSPSDESGRLSDEGPQRTVNISALFMSETEVTERQWEDVMGWSSSCNKRGDNYPTEGVTWLDCVSFCNKLSVADGYTKCYTIVNIGYSGNHITSADVSCDFEANGYRLPTEAEWEYACRAGTTTRFHTGDSEFELGRAGWYDDNSGSQKREVAQKEVNEFGLYDTHGNVCEWCWDWHDLDYYETRPDPDSDPTGPETGALRILRGGGWWSIGDHCRSAFRDMHYPHFRDNSNGFRLCRSPK